jgi:hypothetical protein
MFKIEFLKLTTCCTVLKRETSEQNVSTTNKSMKWKFLESQERKKKILVSNVKSELSDT